MTPERVAQEWCATPHPQMQAILLAQKANAAPPTETMPTSEARALFERLNVEWNHPLPEMASDERTVGGVPCRMLVPSDRRDGLVVFVHGGGWTFGSPRTHERFARLLAYQTRRAFLLPDYRLAPEHPAPAAIEDILSVLAHIEEAGTASQPVVLCGDSAGANIALAAAIARPGRPLALLSLLYGCFAPVFDTASHRRNGDGRFGLTTEKMRWYWGNWLGEAKDSRAAPLHGILTQLPRCHLVAAALDPLCDDSLMLADRLACAGIPTRLDIIPGVVHGFLQMTARLEPARAATTLIATEIAAALDGNEQEGTP